MNQHYPARGRQHFKPAAYGILTPGTARLNDERNTGMTPFNKNLRLPACRLQQIGRKYEHNAVHERNRGQHGDGMPPEGRALPGKKLLGGSAARGAGPGQTLSASGCQ